MNIHSFISTSTLTALVLSCNSYAQEVEGNSQFFTKMYAGFCMKNINDFEALRTKLVNSKLPKFPPDQAKNFLHGKVGDAWPVPHQGQMGNFVLALLLAFVLYRFAGQTKLISNASLSNWSAVRLHL